jgi:D-3-phosphoglycerate dehydrogenase
VLALDLPRDYDDRVYAEYLELLPLAGTRDEVTVWVCNPLGPFISKAELARYPNLKILATASTGQNHINLEACQKRNIRVLSLLDDRAGLETIQASAEFTFKLLLDGFKQEPRRELYGKQIGLLGYGRIGKKVHRYCGAFGARIQYYDPYILGSSSLAEIFAGNDAVVICCSLDRTTCSLVKLDLLLTLVPEAVLVNTARAEIIDEAGLYKALAQRPDVHYLTDVVHGEVEGRASTTRARLVALGAAVTPHIAGATFESRTKAARILLGLLRRASEAT